MLLRSLKRLPFTLLAVGSLVFLAVSAALPPSSVQTAMLGAARIFIIPVYGVLLSFSALIRLFGGPETGPIRDVIASTAFVLALIPFIGADLLLHRLRRKGVAGA